MQYAITDACDSDQSIYGVIEAPDAEYALGHLTDEHLLWAEKSGRPRVPVVIAADRLADGRWRELAPLGPYDAGEIGGDIQMGAAWTRQFALRRPDGQWAVITDSFYAACNDGVSGPVTDESELYVQNQIQWLVCTDLSDLGGTETWSDHEYEDEERVYRMDELERVDERARIRAARKDVDSYSWDGEDE
jgi:hypothetical protein